MSDQTLMTKGERGDLGRLIRKREQLMKTATAQRSAVLMADFESQLSAIYHYDDDATWKQAHDIAKASIDKANAEIAHRCEELGIHKEFAPSLDFHWYRRGSNAIKERRAELRKMAEAQVKAAERSARTQIEQFSLEAQTELIALGLASDAAKLFLEQMPTAEELMPRLDAVKIRGLLK